MWLQLLQTLAALTAILALIFALAYVLRRLKLSGTFADSGVDGWRVLAVKTLAPKRQIYFLEVGSRILLLGVTDRSMNSLLEITDPAEQAVIREAVGRKKRATPSFHDFLRKAGA